MKPEKPITRKEMYLDVATGGSTELPSPVTREEKYLAKIAGESVDIPTPVTRYEMLLAAVAGESYTLTPVTRLEIYLAKAAGQDVEIPQPVTREEMYWFDYCGGTPTPPEREYTGAVPVTFVADGTPLLDLLISGNEEHSGTPSPDNPIMPQGTGERTENLFDEVYGTITTVVTYKAIYVGNGEFTLSTTAPQPDGCLLFLLAGNVSSGASTSTNGVDKNHSRTVTAIDGYITIGYVKRQDDVPSNYHTMLNTGSTALPYEPWGIKIPISSANTTTPVYLGEVETERKVKKLVLTGEEFAYVYANADIAFRINTSDAMLNYRYCVCTHFVYQRTPGGSKIDGVTAGAGDYNLYFTFSSSSAAQFGVVAGDTNSFKAYLAQQYAAGTPVTIWYVLATPETAVVNEPLMKIGDYADTLSYAQAGVSIPTANGSTTLDVETTVKPSEIYIKYKGV